MNVSPAGLDLIKHAEGCRLTAYRDGVGVLTVGYGHTGHDVAEYTVLTQDEADQLLLADIGKFEACVNGLFDRELTQGQFDALVSFAFNLGCATLRDSTLRRNLNEGDAAGAAAEFKRWNHAGGQVVAGLTTRRAAEAAMFSA